MKQIITLFIILFSFAASYAQPCIISGQVVNKKDTVIVVNLLYAGAHYRNQFVELPLSEEGEFKQQVDLPYPIFALLKYNGFERMLLLSPGRNLNIVLDAEKNQDNMFLSGTAAKENILLHRLKIGDIPFFMQGSGEDNVYATMPLDSLQEHVLSVLKNDALRAEQQIGKAGIPQNLQQILATEYRYVNQCYLYDLAQNHMRWAKNKDQEGFLDKVMGFEPLPDSTALVNCLYANMMLDNYNRHQLNKAGKAFKTNPEAAKRTIEQLLQMPFEEINKQAEEYGERYILSWLYAKQNLPVNLQDKILFNRIIESCDNKLYSTAKIFEDTLQRYFPNSHYLVMAKPEVAKLKLVLEQQKRNEKIVIHSGKKVRSLKELAGLYKGKVVYLDIWGTWCGPCREEMGYVPELKKRYAGKDIVFVYIDMDDDNKEAMWKEMAYLYELEGEHYRLNNDEIQNCWKEIENEGGVTNRYPTYGLFDRNGKMVKANAERPGSREKLYRQLDEVL